MGKIFVSFTIVSPSNFFLIAREDGAPLAEVYRSTLLTPPHIQRNLVIAPVNPVMHSVELWTTIDNINPNTMRARCSVDASIDTKVSFTPVTFVVGSGRAAPHYDPAPFQTEWTNPDIVLKFDVATDSYNFVVSKGGFGMVDIGTHLELMPDGHGFKWIDGQEFGDGEEYTLMINELTTVPSGGGQSGMSFPEDIIEITDDLSFTTTHYNKMLLINGIDPVLTVGFASLGAIPEGTKFGIQTHNGAQRYCSLFMGGGASCLINGVARNPVYIGKGEMVSFLKKGNQIYIINGGEEMGRVGQRVQADSIAPPNGFPETGGWHLKDDYPRFFYWYIDELSPSEIVMGIDDITPSDDNKGKFNIGATKFWIPDTTNYFIRATTSGRLSGNKQADTVGSHTHPGISSIPTGAHASGSSALSGAIRFLVNTEVSGGNQGTANLTVSANSSGVENNVKNIAANFYRLI